eukprot:TRINITY_DN7477_c0_g2_i2.p1 TRINITY_DN7477_c0_g2~~TRINITY_DN7477_c0_g2_i2.p1  ORF type:complete len:648 (+),score=67.94 TRINITY_DN7477_c0_g2_i2:48-1991(+)
MLNFGMYVWVVLEIMQKILLNTSTNITKIKPFRVFTPICTPFVSPLLGCRKHWKLGSSSVQVGARPEEEDQTKQENNEVTPNFLSSKYAPQTQQQTQQPTVYHDFNQLGLRQELLEALYENDLSKPTEIQVMAIPKILDGEDVLIASHTGSGKTLAYLLPVVHKLKQEEDEGVVSRVKRPRALILGPTRELTDQILAVTKLLCHRAKFRSLVLNAGREKSKQRKFLQAPIDIVVATPTRFLQHINANNVFIGDIRYLVLDEADTLFDEGFGPQVFRVLELLRKKNQQNKRQKTINTLQCMLVGASVPYKLQKLIDENFPGLQPLKTKTLHKGVSGAKHVFQALGPGEDKLEMLLQLLEPLRREGEKMMVFCNTTNCCRAVEHFLHERGMKTICFHGEVPLRTRKEQMKQFIGFQPKRKQITSGESTDEQEGEFIQEGKQPEEETSLEQLFQKQQQQEEFEEAASEGAYEGDLSVEQGDNIFPVMVCTDLAARGLDIPGDVQHVINFDFPKTSIDYIHRTGRTARAGRGGTVTSLVQKKDRVLADKIEWALGHNQTLDQLTGKVMQVPTKTRPKKEREVRERKFVAWFSLNYSERVAMRRKFDRMRNWSMFQKDKAYIMRNEKLRRAIEFKKRELPRNAKLKLVNVKK